MTTIYVGSDHNGYNLKHKLIEYLETLNHRVIDVGPFELNPKDDFPIYAQAAVNEVLAFKGQSHKAILICGSGQGMAMAANRFKGIRASLCWNEAEAYSSRHDDDANVLCLSASQTSIEEMQNITLVWLKAEFAKAPRFVRRLNLLDQIG